MQQQQQHLGQNVEDDYNDKYEEDEETEKPLESAKTQTKLKASSTKNPQTQQLQQAAIVSADQQELSESEHEPHLQQLQQPQSQNNLASNPSDPIARSWFFKNGEYYPKPAKVHKKRRGKKAHLQGSKLFPYQDPHSDRIVNQLMYVPPNYEEIKASGKLKTILLYNGLGPWNVKAGKWAS